MSPRAIAYAVLLGGAVLGLVAAGQAAGLSQALAGAALAGTVLLLVLRTRGRQVVGGALALLGAGLVAAAVAAAATPVGWRTAYAGAGLLVLAGGAVTILTSPRWIVSTERFRTSSDEPADLWRAQDAGLDPTAEPESPDVRKTSARDTMNQAEQPRRPRRK